MISEINLHFYRGLSYQQNVRPSVGPSVKRVVKITKETCAKIFIPYQKCFDLVFWQGEWMVGDETFCRKFWVKLTGLKRKRRFSMYIHS